VLHRARFARPILWLGLMAGTVFSGLAVVRAGLAQEPAAKGSAFAATASAPANSDMIRDVVAGVKNGEHALYLYERIERVEVRKDANDGPP
jgi:hypothetical protein